MSDIDVLIPEQTSRLAIEVLHEHGWKAESEEYLEYNMRYGKSMMFYNADGYQFDLHWYPFFESHSEVVRSDFWDKAVPLTFLNTETLSLCAEDNLLHTIIHGMRYNPEPPVRWIADAMVLLSAVSGFDWGRFLRLTTTFKLSLQVTDAIMLLQNDYGLKVPESVVQQLTNAKISPAERRIHAYNLKHTDCIPEGFFSKLYYLYIGYLRQSEKKGYLPRIIGFMRYLRFRTKGKNYLEIVVYYVRRYFKASKQNRHQ
jgi:hypothetical protein